MGNMPYCFKQVLSNSSFRQRWCNHYKVVMSCAIPVLILVCALSVYAGSIRVEGTEERVTEAAVYEPVLICRGDSLWSIAKANLEHPTNAKIQEYVKEIISLNNMSSTSIHEGNYILIPRYNR